MKKRDELLAVAERCEKASEGSRELDGRIWCAVSGLEFVMWDGAGCVYRGKDGIGHIAYDHVKNWSTSLDAAMTLVPSGMEIELTDIYGVARAGVGLNVTSGPCYGEHKGGYLALALCAAALRAQAEMES